MRTVEEKLKFDSGLTIGKAHCVCLLFGHRSRKALVEISKRGIVRILPKPEDSDMYTGWNRIKGDTMSPDGAIIVWAARNPELMHKFAEPIATIQLQEAI